MLTTVETPVAAPVYPAYRPYDAVVRRILRLSPHFVRVTFTGEDFTVIGTSGLDQRIKLVLPHADGTVCASPSWSCCPGRSTHSCGGTPV